MKDALASIGDEGRESCDKLRVAAYSIDPEMSEWGNLIEVMFYYQLLNS